MAPQAGADGRIVAEELDAVPFAGRVAGGQGLAVEQGGDGSSDAVIVGGHESPEGIGGQVGKLEAG